MRRNPAAPKGGYPERHRRANPNDREHDAQLPWSTRRSVVALDYISARTREGRALGLRLSAASGP